LPATASRSGLGHRYHRQILKGWPLNRFPWLIERSAQMIHKYGITSVFLARFTAVVRAFVPLLAGILRMSSRHFYVANILSALVWAPMHVFPGVLVGLAIAVGGAHAPQLSLAAVGVLISAWNVWSMIKRKTAGVMDAQRANTRPDQAPANLPRGPLSRQTALDSQIVRELVKAQSAQGLKPANAGRPRWGFSEPLRGGVLVSRMARGAFGT
jgi:SNARE associated Golgi protein